MIIEQTARDAMLDVILSWARFDTFVSKWMSVAFGTSPDATIILMGNMDTRNKIDKLKALYEHFGLASGAANVEGLRKAHSDHVDVRNSIAHLSCVGRLKSEPERIVFSTLRRIKGHVGQSEIRTIHLEQMVAAVNFALEACASISIIIDNLERPIAEPSR
jgi:hypothetical protein